MLGPCGRRLDDRLTRPSIATNYGWDGDGRRRQRATLRSSGHVALVVRGVMLLLVVGLAALL